MDLAGLLLTAVAEFQALPEAERARQRAEQKLSYAWGNLRLSGQDASLETFRQAARELMGDEYPEGWEPR